MIPIPEHRWFSVVIMVTVLPLFILWGRDIWRKVTRHWEPSEDKIVNCPSCQYTFFVRPRKQSTVCPACREPFRVRMAKSKHLRY